MKFTSQFYDGVHFSKTISLLEKFSEPYFFSKKKFSTEIAKIKTHKNLTTHNRSLGFAAGSTDLILGSFHTDFQ